MHDIAARKRAFSTVTGILRAFVTRRERWGLSLYGWLALLGLVAGTSAFVFFTIYPFLAVTDTIPGDILVVEGWVHDYAIVAAINEGRARGATEIFTTGGPTRGNGSDRSDYAT